MTPKTTSSQALSHHNDSTPVDAVTVRLDEFKDVCAYAHKHFGADSEAAVLLRARQAEIEIELAAAQTANNNDVQPATQRDLQNEMLANGLMKSPVLLVGLGFTVVVAMMGFSTLFIGMLAAKWLTF